MFALLDNGLRIADGRLQYAHFHLRTPAGERWRAVTLLELRYLPIETRDDPDILGKQWAAVRGLYNAGVDFVYAAAGMFTPDHLGVVQYYGAAAESDQGEEQAAASAARQCRAVEAVLANYPQARLEPADPARVAWLTDFIAHQPHALACIGHPDPRQAKRGLGRDGALGEADDDLASQQNEILFRGLARLRENFVFLLTSERLAQGKLAEALVRIAELAGAVASRRRGAISVGFSISLPLMGALAQGRTAQNSAGQGAAHTTADGTAESHGTAHTDSWAETQSHAVSHGKSESWGEGVTRSTGWSESDGVSQAHTDSSGQANSHTVGQAHTESNSHTSSQSVASTSSQSSNWAHTDSQGASQSASDSAGWSHNEGASQGQSAGQSGGQSWSLGTNASTSQSQTDAASQGLSVSSGESHGASAGASHAESSNWNVGANASANAGATFEPEIAGTQLGSLRLGGAAGVSAGHGWGSTDTTSLAVNQSQSTGVSASAGQSHAVSSGQSQGVSAGVGGSQGWSESESQSSSVSDGVSGGHTTGQAASVGASDMRGGSNSVSHSVVSGSADTRGTADSRSESWGTTDSQGQADSSGTSHAVSRSGSEAVSSSHAWGVSESETFGEARTVGGADSTSHAVSQSHAEADSASTALARGAGAALSGGLSTGMIPGFSIQRSWQTKDDVAERATEVLRALESQLNQASAEGGFMADAYLFLENDAACQAAAALIPQAFHGPRVPTPVQTLNVPASDLESVREHALAWRACAAPAANDPFDGLLWRRYSTLLTAGQLAAYTAPGLFEEGAAVTVQEKLPPLAFYPALPGEVILGRQVSPETGDLTPVPLRLSRERHFHTAFCGDTGYGKSVAAMRLAYETTVKWRLRTIVLDFGAGWRALLNAPGLEGHADLYQLSPGGPRPFRWNPLQIGRHIPPEIQWRAFGDIFGATLAPRLRAAQVQVSPAWASGARPLNCANVCAASTSAPACW